MPKIQIASMAPVICRKAREPAPTESEVSQLNDQSSSGGGHSKPPIALFSQQEEESPQVRTESYQHDSVGYAVQVQDTESRVVRRAGIKECILLVEQNISNGPTATAQNSPRDDNYRR